MTEPTRAGTEGCEPIPAFHLPGLEESDVERWTSRQYGAGGITLRFPVLREGALTRVIERLHAARSRHMEPLRPAAIAKSVGLASRRLAEPGDPLRQLAEAALPDVTGYSPAMIRLILDRAAADWDERTLLALLNAELPGDPLDRVIRHPVTRARIMAVGPRLAFHVFSGNVPGVAVTALIRSLLVKAATLGKTATGEPLLPVLFARALESVDAGLASCLAVTHWPGGQSLVEDEALVAANVVVTYGGGDAVRSIRSRAPVTARIVEHGPRVSVGLVGRDSLRTDAMARAAAARVAWAVSLFDQHGCVSPHVIWVENGAVDSHAFAHRLAEAMDLLAVELPRGRLSAAEAVAIHEERTRAEFRAIEGEDVEVLEGRDASWVVIHDASPAFEASCLNRTLRVKPVARLEDVPELIEPLRGFVQTVAVEGAGERIRELAFRVARAGATRITDFERMPWPPYAWHHDGGGPLLELVTWVDHEI